MHSHAAAVGPLFASPDESGKGRPVIPLPQAVARLAAGLGMPTSKAIECLADSLQQHTEMSLFLVRPGEYVRELGADEMLRPGQAAREERTALQIGRSAGGSRPIARVTITARPAVLPLLGRAGLLALLRELHAHMLTAKQLGACTARTRLPHVCMLVRDLDVLLGKPADAVVIPIRQIPAVALQPSKRPGDQWSDADLRLLLEQYNQLLEAGDKAAVAKEKLAAAWAMSSNSVHAYLTKARALSAPAVGLVVHRA
jgi:hypothetical protein